MQQCWRETKLIGVVWILTLIYCTTVFARLGYIAPELRPEDPPMIWGIPLWVFWGLFVPWVALIFFAWFFAVFIMRDDEPFMPFPKEPGNDAPDRN